MSENPYGDSFMNVELFLIANDRLPSQEKDSINKDMVRKVIRIAQGIVKSDRQEQARKALPYAYHMYGLMGCKGGNDCPTPETHGKGYHGKESLVTP